MSNRDADLFGFWTVEQIRHEDVPLDCKQICIFPTVLYVIERNINWANGRWTHKENNCCRAVDIFKKREHCNTFAGRDESPWLGSVSNVLLLLQQDEMDCLHYVEEANPFDFLSNPVGIEQTFTANGRRHPAKDEQQQLLTTWMHGSLLSSNRLHWILVPTRSWCLACGRICGTICHSMLGFLHKNTHTHTPHHCSPIQPSSRQCRKTRLNWHGLHAKNAQDRILLMSHSDTIDINGPIWSWWKFCARSLQVVFIG